jgi:hypothetical protein
MCKASRPRMPAIPPPRAAKQFPTRSGVATAATARMMAEYGARPQIPAFTRPTLTAKMGGDTVVLGG